MKYDYIVWDFNGTILDDLDLCLDILNTMLEKRNLKTVTIEQYRDVFRFPVIDYYKDVGFDFKKESFEVLSKEFVKYYQTASFNCGFCETVIDTIHTIKNTYNISQIVLSASKKENLDEQLNVLGIKDLFDHVYGISNIYAESKVHIAERFRERVGKDKKILFIGDSTHDAEVADAINADCILVCQGHQSKKRLLESKHQVVDYASQILKELD